MSGYRVNPEDLQPHQQHLMPAKRAPVGAKASGDSWEKELRALHKRYAEQGRAMVFDFTPPYIIRRRGPVRIRDFGWWHKVHKMIGGNAANKIGNFTVIPAGWFLAIPKGKGPPDMVAVVGRWAWLFDAKTTTSTRWPLSNLKPHQADAFDAWEKQAAGRAGVLLRLAGCPGQPRFLVPWTKLGPVWRKWKRVQDLGHKAKSGSASLSLGDARTLGVEFDADGWIHAVVGRLV